MDLAGLRARVRELSGIHMVELASDARLNAIINETYLEIAGQYEWPFLYEEQTVATVAGTATATLPAALRLVSAVTIQTGGERRRLEQVSVEFVDRQAETGDSIPSVYARVDEDQLLLWPNPDGAYTLTVRGWGQAATLEGDTAVPVFSAEFHPAIAYGAASRLLVEEGDDSGRSEAYMEQAARGIASMLHRYLETHDGGTFQMGGRAPQRRRRRWL